jgi:hypothetical protein
MPSLKDILHDMLIVIANDDDFAGLAEGDPTHIIPPKPSPAFAESRLDQSIWYWEKAPNGANPADPGFLGQVTHVNCWARWMAESHKDDNLGWMTVCDSITWSPVKVDVTRGGSPFRLTLPLTEKYVVKTVFFAGGHNPGKGWWPSESDVDSSFFQVFVYDITGKTSSDNPDPVPKDVYEHDDFMPDPAAEPLPAAPTLSPGEQVDLTAAHKHFVCVVMSLVCGKERADFEPGGLVGVARPVPHFMVMTNMPVDGIQGTIRIERPDESGYHGTSTEAGRPPMQHHDMDPPIRALAATDCNLFRPVDVAGQISIPYWDLIFDYVIAAPDSTFAKLNDDMKVVKNEPQKRTLAGSVGLLDYGLVAKAVRGAVEAPLATGGPVAPFLVPLLPAAMITGGAEGGTIVFARPGLRIVHQDPSSKLPSDVAQKLYGASGLRKDDLLPRKMVDAVKWPRQGQFDSIHLAPRMKADLLLGRSAMQMPAWADTLDAIIMAPFCEHDCMHTHWRWGANWNDIRNAPLLKSGKQISGFGGVGAAGKFSGVGVPNTEIGAPLVPLNQEVTVSFESDHAFKYTGAAVKDIKPGVWQAIFHHGSAYAVSIVGKGAVDALVAITTACRFDDVDDQWSEFYWTLRFQDTMNGPLERIELSDANLAALMGL